jgi:hypothetical protein
MPEQTTAELAQAGYEAYVTRAGGKSLISGEQLPGWVGLPAEIREAWEAATEAILDTAGYYAD